MEMTIQKMKDNFSVDVFYDHEREILIVQEPDGTESRFNHFQLREAKEIMHSYKYANFHPTSQENEKKFHEFVIKMGVSSPEVHDVISPFLN